MKKLKMKKILSAVLILVLALLAFQVLGVDGVLQVLGFDAGDAGIIGGADGPTQIILSEEKAPTQTDPETPGQESREEEALTVSEDGEYDSKDEVALYIHLYGHVPSNYVTKTKAQKAGWSGGALNKILPGKSIGGGGYNNLEGTLPDAPGRTWKECDIDTIGKSSRGAKRIVYSNDGLIYYTDDHYETFELLYGEP